jgi:hypothetical protein
MGTFCHWDIRYNTKKPRSCAADKPTGRGQKLKYSAVKEYALANNILYYNHK